ncbi:MAG: thiamine biosynthesis protein ThiH [Sphingobacteriales bacterium 50-39]|nr:2-iminoacetate synthase ThiH [Sphingobacteriales bacterium]OJW58633.1 MAG: thiamine biosynthesis protein ThiH [Sphingobacteriales bacterium 50-39]
MFLNIFQQHEWAAARQSIYDKTAADVERALARNHRDLEDFKALISPAAAPYLETMAQISHQLTLRRFGRIIQMYIPLYLSNECQNICTYCGFSYDNKIRRRTLNAGELLREVAAIRDLGFEHVLLVSGEANQTVGVDYFIKALQTVRPHFANISMEVQPLDQDDYERLIQEGLYSVLVYQETYHREDYKLHHPKGKKSNFNYRLDTPDRLGRAGIHKMGLGVLIGLEDWRTDSFFTALHLQYLERTYWKTKYSISFPRLRPHAGGLVPKVTMSDRELIQLICAYRLLDEEVELSLSTRESPVFRDHAIKLGITSISAGSRTNPGGYVVDPGSLEQFEIHDDRSPRVIAEMIRKQGNDPVWKDWDPVLQ